MGNRFELWRFSDTGEVMKVTLRLFRVVPLAVALSATTLILAASAAQAQTEETTSRWSASWSGGAFSYDLAGTGTTAFVAFRGRYSITRLLLVEPGFTFTAFKQQLGPTTPLGIPEVQLQLQFSDRRVRPYIGAGVGMVANLQSNRSGSPLIRSTLSASGGVRVRVAGPWSVGGELRARSIDPWVGSAAEWTVGVTRRF
jgi:hypothetical protein